MTKISPAIDDTNNKLFVEFAGYDFIRCEICFAQFHTRKGLVKLSPCEHNFCEQCILSLRCHQQYYLLDSINCPTCCTDISNSAVLAATTNYALCQFMEATQVQQVGTTSDGDITIIHVPDKHCVRGNRFVRMSSRQAKSKSSCIPERCQPVKCIDCHRKMNENEYRKKARFCAGCFNTEKDDDDCLRVACLQCCVNQHNGHKLITVKELEHEHQELIKDLHTLQQVIKETNKWIDVNLKILSEQSAMRATDYASLCKAKQNLQNECEADMNFALSVLKNGDATPSPPRALQRMRQHQYYNNARLHKLLHFIEKYHQSIKERYNGSAKEDTSMIGQNFELVKEAFMLRDPNATTDKRKQIAVSHLPMLSPAHQKRITLFNSVSDDRSAAEAIAVVLTVRFNRTPRDESGTRTTVLQEAMRVMNRKNPTKSSRRAALLCCAKQLRESIDENIDRQLILLYIDAYLHVFYQLNLLVTRLPSYDSDGDTTAITRWDIWKLIQVVYSDLMKYTAKHWECDESERVDLVDDLAFLCFLYSDVSDEATITICMIEAARFRASTAVVVPTSATDNAHGKMTGAEDDRRRTMNIRLDLIDAHLLECRRLQKLQRSSAAVVIKPEKCTYKQSLEGLRKLLSTCFNKFKKHQ